MAEVNIQYQEDLTKIRQSMGADQRSSVKANIDQINMQRDLKDKSAKLQFANEKVRVLETVYL